MDSVGDHGDEESIDSTSPRAAPVGKDCFSEPATSAVGRGTPPRRRPVWIGGDRAQLGLNSEATELPQMNSFPGLLQSSPVRGTGPSPSTGGRAERHGTGEDTAATVGKSFRSHRNAGSAGSGGATATAGVSGAEAANLEDEDQGFDLGYSMNFSSSDDKDETSSSDDEDETLKVALNQLNMMQQYGAIAACMLCMYYHDTFMKKSKKRKTNHPDMNRK